MARRVPGGSHGERVFGLSGIVCLVNGHPVARDLASILGRLPERRYDAAGIAVAGQGLGLERMVGGAAELDAAMADHDGPLRSGHAGIARAHWLSQWGPPLASVDPVMAEGVAVVQNGLIENGRELRAELAGTDEASGVDGTVVPRLIAQARAAGAPPAEALRAACERLRGAYAIAALFADAPDQVIVCAQGSPLAVARGAGGTGACSDIQMLDGICQDFSQLEHGDVAELSNGSVRISDRRGRAVERPWRRPDPEPMRSTGAYSFRTRADIAAQRTSLARTETALRERAIPSAIAAASRLILVASGSARHAALAARVWIERFTAIPCDVESANEFHTREAPPMRGSVGVLISRSGESREILAALDLFRARAIPTVAITDAALSRLARGADLPWNTEDGADLAFVSIKSLAAQLAALVRLGLALAASRGTLPPAAMATAERAMREAGTACALAEAAEARYGAIAVRIARAGQVLMTGRGWGAAIAAEGALQLQAQAGLRAVAAEAGELRRGPLAMLGPSAPVVLCAAGERTLGPLVVDAESVRACGADVVALIESVSASAFAPIASEVVALPGRGIANMFAQLVAVQLIAYHAGLALGQDVDRPRHLWARR